MTNRIADYFDPPIYQDSENYQPCVCQSGQSRHIAWQLRDARSQGFWRGMVLGVLVMVAIISVWAAAAAPAKGATIDKANRVANTKEPNWGVCWPACAEMIGKQFNIVPLKNFVEVVVKDGTGHRSGFSSEEVTYYTDRLNLKVESQKEIGLGIPVERRQGKDARILFDAVDRGLAAIVGVHNWDGRPGAHAIIVLDFSHEKEKWSDGAVDYGVRYMDPNEKAPKWTTWAFFFSHWTNEAYVFDPDKQEAGIAGPRPLRPGRLMLNGTWAPISEKDFVIVPQGPLHAMSPTIYPHQLPFFTGYPKGEMREFRIPSNQDIKDGVARPDDTLHIPDLLPSKGTDHVIRKRPSKDP